MGKAMVCLEPEGTIPAAAVSAATKISAWERLPSCATRSHLLESPASVSQLQSGA